MKNSFLLFIFCCLLFSCKKKEEIQINSCANGVKDAGEEDVDCGGTCKACYHFPYLIFSYNDVPKQPDSKSIFIDNGDYILECSFDTVSFQINMGSNMNPGLYNIQANKSGCISGQIPYAFLNGVIGINENNTINKTLKGNFQVKFFKGIDTLNVNSGQFDYLPY